MFFWALACGRVASTIDHGAQVANASRQEDFTLDQVGNWKTYLTKQDAGGGLQTETDHDRAVNDANEITGLTQRTGAWVVPVYDTRGNVKELLRAIALLFCGYCVGSEAVLYDCLCGLYYAEAFGDCELASRIVVR